MKVTSIQSKYYIAYKYYSVAILVTENSGHLRVNLRKILFHFLTNVCENTQNSVSCNKRITDIVIVCHNSTNAHTTNMSVSALRSHVLTHDIVVVLHKRYQLGVDVFTLKCSRINNRQQLKQTQYQMYVHMYESYMLCA